MARRKKYQPPKPPKQPKTSAERLNETVTLRFNGGPRHGLEMIVLKSAVPPRIRLAIPEWANYYRREGTYDFDYRDDEWVPVPFSFLSSSV